MTVHTRMISSLVCDRAHRGLHAEALRRRRRAASPATETQRRSAACGTCGDCAEGGAFWPQEGRDWGGNTVGGNAGWRRTGVLRRFTRARATSAPAMPVMATIVSCGGSVCARSVGYGNGRCFTLSPRCSRPRSGAHVILYRCPICSRCAAALTSLRLALTCVRPTVSLHVRIYAEDVQ